MPRGGFAAPPAASCGRPRPLRPVRPAPPPRAAGGWRAFSPRP